MRGENNQLKQALNFTNYRLDNLEQYRRRENLRLHNVPDSLTNGDNAEAEAIKIANAINISLNKAGNQRAHCLDKRNGKSCPIIVRFQSYKKRNDFLQDRLNLKNTDEFKQVFITKDLDPNIQ